MRALSLDFRREQRGPRWPGLLLLAGGIACAVVAADQYRHTAAELVQAQASLARKAAGKPAVRRDGNVQRDVQRTALDMKRAGDIARQLKVPWNDLFAAVESASRPEVALLSIDSDGGKRQIQVTGEAKDLDAVLDYLRVLVSQPKLFEVYLQSHQIQEERPQQPVRFVLAADWSPGQ